MALVLRPALGLALVLERVLSACMKGWEVKWPMATATATATATRMDMGMVTGMHMPTPDLPLSMLLESLFTLPFQPQGYLMRM